MRCFIKTHRLVSSDGAEHDLYLSDVTDDRQQPLFFCLPAMGVPARKYLPLAEAFKKNNCSVALFEWRGIESSSLRASRKNDFGYYEILTHDLPEALAKVREYFPDNPIYILGHSLGGQLGLLFMCQEQHQMEGMVGVATGTPYYKGWKFPYNVGLYISSKLMRWLASMIGHFPGRTVGFAGREAKRLIHDWSKTVSSGEYHVQGSPHHFETLCHQMHKRALMMTVDDDILAPIDSTKNLANKLSRSEVTFHHFQAADFPSNQSGHFNWMKEPEVIVKRIVEWL